MKRMPLQERIVGEVPQLRVRCFCDRPVQPAGEYVLYWMTAARRLEWNFALQRAVGWAKQLGRPLVVVEVLTCGGRWDTDRTHSFVLQGMAENARCAQKCPLLYYPYVEHQPGQARLFLTTLSQSACLVVTDEFPNTQPGMISEADLPVRGEMVDSCGVLPWRAADRVFPTAFAFRRFLQQQLREHLLDRPKADPCRNVALPRISNLPEQVRRQWPTASEEILAGVSALVNRLPIDHHVPPVPTPGGRQAALKRWKEFFTRFLADYPTLRNHPDACATSGLSPYLHYGYISTYEIFYDIAQAEGWKPDHLAPKPTGRRQGWWGLSESAEEFLDQLITWRELGYNFCFHRPDFDQYESLPDWVRRTLAKHRSDPRPYQYRFEQFASAQTHDRLWNAAQRQLLLEGILHNYLRMLWGKKILEWSSSPEEALSMMIELNNRYALDGQDPNSYSGIFWILGRYDRPWGPERPIFGSVRYMSSENTLRKIRVKQYLETYTAKTPN